MKIFFLFTILFTRIFSTPEEPHVDITPEIVFNSNFLKLKFPKKYQSLYPPNYHKNVTLSNIALDSNKNIYVALPRFKKNVPFTLGILDSSKNTISPFPSYETNNCNNSDCFNHIVALEIDADDVMWILDNPKLHDTHLSHKPRHYRLIKFSIPDNKFLSIFTFRNNVDVFNTSSLTDIALDTENVVVYIVDSGREYTAPLSGNYNSSILVYDDGTQLVKRILHNSVYTNRRRILPCPVSGSGGGGNCDVYSQLSSVSLNCDFSTLYFASLNDDSLFSLPTEKILMYNNDVYLNSSVEYVREIPSASGMIVSAGNIFYLTNGNNNTINYIKETMVHDNKICSFRLMKPSKNMSYPFKFSFDDEHLYVLSNSFGNFIADDMDEKNMYNYVIWKFSVDDGSSISGCSFRGYRIGILEISSMIGFTVGFLILGVIVVLGEWGIQILQHYLKKKKENSVLGTENEALIKK